MELKLQNSTYGLKKDEFEKAARKGEKGRDASQICCQTENKGCKQSMSNPEG